MKVIVGLGNPGRQYENTRHNIGFIAIDRIAEKLGISYGNAKAMLSHMNAFGITTGEFNEAVRATGDKTDKE